ncbi:MAG TPA: DUF4386 domain-containing protein [Gaiellaceae bacterium]
MSSDQRTARIVGWLFIGTFVFSIPGLLLYGPVLHHHGTYVLGGGHDTQIAFGAFLEILSAICGVGTAVALYPVAKRQSEGFALGYVAIRIVETTIIVAGIVSIMAVVTLRHDLAGTGANAGTLSIAARSLVAVKDWTFLLGPGFCSGIGNGLILGYLMYRSGLVPRRSAQFAMFAGACAFIAATGALFGVYAKQSTPQGILTIPEIIWEAFFGVYLVVKGFKAASPILRGDGQPSVTASPAPPLG